MWLLGQLCEWCLRERGGGGHAEVFHHRACGEKQVAGEGDLVVARAASGASTAVGENAASEVTLELRDDVLHPASGDLTRAAWRN